MIVLFFTYCVIKLSEIIFFCETAKEQTDRIWQAIKKLELFPKSHQDRLVGRYAGKEYKQLIIDNYIAIFKVDENKKKVFVLTVQYQGRQM